VPGSGLASPGAPAPAGWPIFDGHNDVLLRLHRAAGQGREESFLERAASGHLDLPRARAGGFAGGLFAVFVPSGRSARPRRRDMPDRYALPVPKPPGLMRAQQVVGAMAARLFRLERQAAGELEVVRTVERLRHCLERGVLAVVFHLEGAEAIDPGLDALELLHQAGLRSLGPVWSRSNAFGHGVPFAFPSGPDTGPGLTDAGRALIGACNTLGILIDLSHLNEQGFWDVARISTAPLVATHSNAHALCPSARNLTDRQLDAIRESGGMVGLNFAVSMLRDDGKADPDTPIEVMVRHLDHLLARLGEEGVGFGSDFDGTIVPRAIGDAAGLPNLIAALRAHGYDDALLEKLCSANWLALLDRVWRAA